MPRPKNPRILSASVSAAFFKPQGVCLKDLTMVTLEKDEFEAIKLHDFDDCSQTVSARKMGVSQPTFGRILTAAHKKIGKALFEGKAITIQQEERMYEDAELQKILEYTDALCDVCGRYCLAE